MQESSIPLSRILAVTLWASVGGLMIAAWSVLAAGSAEVATMLGLMACATSAGAAVANIRSYSLRVCSLIRATRTQAEEYSGGLTPLR